jgi:hypothetical protein
VVVVFWVIAVRRIDLRQEGTWSSGTYSASPGFNSGIRERAARLSSVSVPHITPFFVLQTAAESRPWHGLSHVSSFLFRFHTPTEFTHVAGERSQPPLKEFGLHESDIYQASWSKAVERRVRLGKGAASGRRHQIARPLD